MKPDIYVFYHSDGNIEAIIPELIEIGVDILNPVQPECMDPAEIKRHLRRPPLLLGHGRHADDDALRHAGGGEGVVRERIATVGKGGGLVIAPTHVIEPDVPWENIVAFFEAIDQAAEGG